MHFFSNITNPKNSNRIMFSPPQISKEMNGSTSNGVSKEFKQQQKNVMDLMKTLPSQSVQDDNVD